LARRSSRIRAGIRDWLKYFFFRHLKWESSSLLIGCAIALDENANVS